MGIFVKMQLQDLNQLHIRLQPATECTNSYKFSVEHWLSPQKNIRGKMKVMNHR